MHHRYKTPDQDQQPLDHCWTMPCEPCLVELLSGSEWCLAGRHAGWHLQSGSTIKLETCFCWYPYLRYLHLFHFRTKLKKYWFPCRYASFEFKKEFWIWCMRARAMTTSRAILWPTSISFNHDVFRLIWRLHLTHHTNHTPTLAPQQAINTKLSK